MYKKSVKHVHSCFFFAYLAYCFFSCSRCHRRCRCLSSLLTLTYHLGKTCDQGEGVKDYRVLDRLALSHGLNIKGHIPYTFKFLMKKNIALKSIQEVIEISRLELH